MNIGFFLRCGKKEGLGHLYRSLQILSSLKENIPCSPYFFLPAYRPARQILKEKKVLYIYLPDKCPASLKLDLAIVDCLNTSQAFGRFIQSRSRAEVHFDDFGRGSQKADILIYGLLGGWENKHFRRNSQLVFAGPDYLSLAPPFSQKRKKQLRKPIKDIYLNFGGSDAKDLAKHYLPFLSKLPYTFHLVSHLRFHYPHLQCYQSVSSETIATLLQKCDLGITTLGISFFEALSQGLPTLTLSVNSHQARRGREAHDRGLTLYLGKAPIAPTTLQRSLAKLSASPSLRKALAKCGKKMIDGKGGKRVTRILLSLCHRLS